MYENIIIFEIKKLDLFLMLIRYTEVVKSYQKIMGVLNQKARESHLLVKVINESDYMSIQGSTSSADISNTLEPHLGTSAILMVMPDDDDKHQETFTHVKSTLESFVNIQDNTSSAKKMDTNPFPSDIKGIMNTLLTISLEDMPKYVTDENILSMSLKEQILNIVDNPALDEKRILTFSFYEDELKESDLKDIRESDSFSKLQSLSNDSVEKYATLDHLLFSKTPPSFPKVVSVELILNRKEN